MITGSQDGIELDVSGFDRDTYYGYPYHRWLTDQDQYYMAELHFYTLAELERYPARIQPGHLRK